MKQPSKKTIAKVVKLLRDSSSGRYVWRVRDKDTKSYCIEFDDWERYEAEQWWKKNSNWHPEYHKNNELARVLVVSTDDKLRRKAASIIEALAAEK